MYTLCPVLQVSTTKKGRLAEGQTAELLVWQYAKQWYRLNTVNMMPVYDYDFIENHKLPTLCSWYGIPYFDAHSAAADCYVLGDLLRHLAEDRMKKLSRA